MTHPSGLTDDERQAYWDAAMHIGPHKYASQRGRFPQLRGVFAKRNLPWRRWAARMFGAAICGGFTRRWE
jgi:hypothetical protein